MEYFIITAVKFYISVFVHVLITGLVLRRNIRLISRFRKTAAFDGQVLF